MAVMKNLALLALLPAALARPQVGHGAEHHHNKFHARSAGTGLPGPFSGTAPYPAGNATLGGATGSTGAATSTGNGAPVYITSIINVVPQPITTDVYDSAGATGAGNSLGNSPASPTGGAPGGEGGSGAGSACGPATVTVTNANTVTVTVAPAGASSPNGPAAASNPNGPAEASAPSSVNIPSVSSAPFPLGNSSAPAGTGTGTGVPTYIAAAPTTTSSVAAVPTTSVAAPQPYVAAAEKVATPAKAAAPAKVAAPAAPEKVAVKAAAAVPSPKAQSSSAPAAQSSSGPKSGKKGVLVASQSQLSSVSGASWSVNWANSPMGMDLPGEFVPQLWGEKDGFPEAIAKAASDASNVLFYNEPDKSLGEGGSQVAVGQAQSDFAQYMKPLQAAGKKISTPCVANDSPDYMASFLEGSTGSIDIMCFHWYGEASVDELSAVVKQFADLAEAHGIPELWLAEFGITSGPCDLSEIIPYLDGAVDRYAYNLNNIQGCTGY